MNADRGLVETRHRADLPRRTISVVTEHEDGALATIEPIDRGRETSAPLASEELGFRIQLRDAAKRYARFIALRVVGGREPALASGTRFSPVEAPIDEDAGKPDFERPGISIRTDVTEGFDEGVLDGFVGLRRVSQVLIGNA